MPLVGSTKVSLPPKRLWIVKRLLGDRGLRPVMIGILVVFAVVLTSTASAATTPTFVQIASAHKPGVSSLNVTPASNITAGNRLIVEVGIWSSGGATAASVIDSAGNKYTELLHFKASENTEMSVWSAPITAGGGTKPTITVKSSATADVGAVALEYSGLSTATDATAVDVSSHATGTTSSAATVASGVTPATTSGNELSLGLYADSGFGDTLTADPGYTARANVSPDGDIELLAEDSIVAAGATPNATAGTGPNTTWLMADLVFKAASAGAPTAPSAPTNVAATAGDRSAAVNWTAPSNGGSPITSYTITPYVGSTAQTATTITGSPPATNTTITGLTDGTSYTFTVTATNAVGSGPASATSNSVTPEPNTGGQWSSVMNWPMVAIHSVLLKNGNVLQWDGWQQPEPTQVWNPSTQTFTTQTAPDSIFCSGVAELPDGRVLVVGGYGGLSTGKIGIVDTNIFDPSTSTWTRVADMHSPRWYPDLTELADGRYVAISGNSTDSSTWADTPEVYDPVANTWTTLSKVNTSQIHEEEYPFSYLAPSGNVFTIGPSEDKSFFLDVTNQTWTQVGGSSGVLNGSSVMYRPGKILYSGGTNTQDSNSPANATTAVIDLTAQTPTWQQTAPMSYPRVYHTLTMLADGTVLAVGGEKTWGQTGSTETTGGVLPSEIWNPATETWTTAAPTGVTRGYHSTAILMPDGTVLVAGSGHANPNYPGQNSAQIYSPPYLFKGARPTISSAPATTTYGSTIPVSTPDASSISAVNLVSLGADTHQSDMDQHFVPLSFTQGSGGLNVQIPSSAAMAPPGNYMLFIVNSNGVPSVASFINVSATAPTAPGAPSGVSAAAGNGSATVTWKAPSDGGSPITSYTITPYIGSTAQTPTTVTGSPPATSATVTGLANGTAYTFRITATNAAGTSPPSAPSNAVTPTTTPPPGFVQGTSTHASGVSSLTVAPTSSVTLGNRLVVETGVWNSSGATVASVSDSAGNNYVELLNYKASDGTEMSVWTAPITAGGGTSPTITVTPTSKADVGIAALEYSGLSTVADATVVDQMAHSSGTTNGSGSVASGATAATTAGNELALGMYADSGFGDTLAPGAGYTARVNVSNTSDMELLAEDQPLSAAGATPNASVTTGGNTIWLMATLVLKAASAGGQQQVAGAVKAASSGGQVADPPTPASTTNLATNVSKVASTGGQATDVVTARISRSRQEEFRHLQRPHHRHHAAKITPESHARGLARCPPHSPAAARTSACRSLRRAAAIARADRARFVYLALVKHLSASLFCFHGHALPFGGNWTGAWLRSRTA